jgi:hypothetical protein
VSLGGGAKTPRKDISVLQIIGAGRPQWAGGKGTRFQAGPHAADQADGRPGVTLATLGDAARFVAWISPSRKARPHWRYAVELLLKAAETRKITDIEAATAQMERALHRDGWL